MRISKKILAIALSILMAVSMMPFTVFAATTHTVTTQAELLSALESAADGDTIELGADITLAGNVISGESATYGAYITKSITLDGKNHKLTSTDGSRAIGVKGVSGNVSVTFKDLTISANSNKANAICICTRGGIDTLTLDNVKLDTPGSGKAYNQPLTIGGTQYTQATVNVVNGSTIQTNDNGTKYYAIILWNPVKLNIQDSTIKGWACVYQKAFEDGTTDSTVVTIDNSTLVSKGIAGSSNHFAAIQTEESEFTCKITNSDIDVTAAANTYQGIASAAYDVIGTGYSVELGEGNDVTLTGDTALVGYNFDDDLKEITVSGGTFEDESGDPYEVADYYLADEVVQDTTTGGIIDVDPTTVAKIGNDQYATLEEAIAAVTEGGTIKLIDDVTVANTIEITDGKEFTINTNGHDISSSVRIFNIRHGQLTIKGTGNLNANFTGANAAVAVYGAATDSGSDYSTFTLTSPATINAPNGYGAMIGANGTGAYGAKLQLGGTINSKYGVYINGNVAEPADKTNAAAIDITGKVTASNENAVVYAAGYAKWNIYSNANLTGGSGVYIKSGDLTVNGGTITANGAKTDYKFNTNGADGTGDAIIIDSCGYPGNVPTVTIKAGTITSANGAAVASYTKQDDPLYPTADFQRVDNVIPGNSTAVFSSNVTELAADDYKTVYDETAGGYVIAPIAYGTVGLYQAGDATITGNGTAHEKITIANTSLNYASADYSVGRYYDGYYMGGVKFIAPEGTVISENARYTNGSVDAQTGELKVKNLYTAKDGANYMYSWPHVTEESLKEAIDAGVNKTWTYTFDWDGDGYFEQEAIIELVCNSVKLVNGGVEVYPAADNGYSLTVDHSIAMNAYIDVDAYVNDVNNATVNVTYNDADALDPSTEGTKTETFTAATVETDDEDRWIATINQAPAQIADEVKIEVIENGVVKREIVTSVADYLVQASTSDDAKLANLAKAMYDYGKATYAESGYVGADNFAHAYFNTTDTDASVAGLEVFNKVNAGDFTFNGLAFVATSTPSLRAYCNYTEAQAVAANLDHLDVSDKTGKVCANLGSVNPEDFDKALSVEINNSASITTNVIKYANLATNSGKTDLGRSIRNYFAAARNYWA